MFYVLTDTCKVGKHGRLHSRLHLPSGPYQSRHASLHKFKGCHYLYSMWGRGYRTGECTAYMASCWGPTSLCNIDAKTHSPSKSGCFLLPKDSMPTRGLWTALGLWEIFRNNLMIFGKLKLTVRIYCATFCLPASLPVTQKHFHRLLLLLR